MKLEVILNGVASITFEDEVNRSDKSVRKLTSFMMDELRQQASTGKKIGFEAGSHPQIENNGHQDNDPIEMPGVIVR